MDQNFFTIALVVVFAIMIFFMFRNSRKRRRDQEEMQSKLLPGAEVMTSHGIYGTVVSLDDEKNEAIIESTPGTRLRLHRQTLTRVVEPAVDEIASNDGSAETTVDAPTTNGQIGHGAAEPEFGERRTADAPADDDAATAAEKPKRAPRTRPASE